MNSNETKTFVYIPPTPPADLIDSTSFTIDFVGRKFLQVGLDPICNLSTVILIITPARHIVITTDFLHCIFNMIGNILSYLLDTPKYKRNIFVCTEATTLSSMVYKGENVLVIKSKTEDGCRVLLTRDDLMRLINLEQTISDSIMQKAAKSCIEGPISCNVSMK